MKYTEAILKLDQLEPTLTELGLSAYIAEEGSNSHIVIRKKKQFENPKQLTLFTNSRVGKRYSNISL